MVDHVYGIPGSVGGQMMIRDTGWSAEFWIKAGNSSAYDYELGWSGVVNGVGVGGTFRYEHGGAWAQIGAWNVGYNQTVTFNKTTNSGSQGLGGTGGFSAWFPRSTVPPAPSIVSFNTIRHESVGTTFSGQGDGGSAITGWQIAFGTNGSSQTGAGNTIYSSSGTNSFSGLKPGQYYAAWARGGNAHGWGPWGPGNSFYTLGGAYVKLAGIHKHAVPYVKVGGIWVPAVPHVKVAGLWKSTTA